MALGNRLDRRRLVSLALGAGVATTLPGSAVAQTRDRQREAMHAAEELSVLEATEHLPALYTFYERLHPDAQEIVPRHVVIGWYQEVWQPRGPQPARATGVRFVDWTWPVNGVTYRDVAEVSFIQEFDNAAPVNDVVRLAHVEGSWRWFFGRDRAWVEEQVRIYTERAYIAQSGIVPFQLDRVVGAERNIIESLPIRIGTAQGELLSDARLIPDYAAHMPVAIQYRDGEFPVGYALATALRHDRNVRDTVDAIVWERVQAPPFTLLAWNLDPPNDVPFARYERFANDAIGNAQSIVWGGSEDDTLWEISFVDEDRLERLARALVTVGTR